jgi:hypothetical protein
LTNDELINKTFLGAFLTEGINPSQSISLNHVISGMNLLVHPGKKTEDLGEADRSRAAQSAASP